MIFVTNLIKLRSSANPNVWNVHFIEAIYKYPSNFYNPYCMPNALGYAKICKLNV